MACQTTTTQCSGGPAENLVASGHRTTTNFEPWCSESLINPSKRHHQAKISIFIWRLDMFLSFQYVHRLDLCKSINKSIKFWVAHLPVKRELRMRFNVNYSYISYFGHRCIKLFLSLISLGAQIYFHMKYCSLLCISCILGPLFKGCDCNAICNIITVF